MPAAAGNRLIVILNDNDMSIAPPVGGLSHYLARLVSSGKYLTLRGIAQKIARKLPRRLHVMARRWEEYARGFWTGGTLFEELGFYYVGPVDGHNLERLVQVLENVRDADEGPMPGPCRHQEGQGLCARRGGGRQISRRPEVRRRSRASRPRPSPGRPPIPACSPRR